MNPGDKDKRQKVIAALLEVRSADVTASLCSLGIVYKGNLTSNRTPFCVWGGSACVCVCLCVKTNPTDQI